MTPSNLEGGPSKQKPSKNEAKTKPRVDRMNRGCISNQLGSQVEARGVDGVDLVEGGSGIEKKRQQLTDWRNVFVVE